jgi:hypothetical protein
MCGQDEAARFFDPLCSVAGATRNATEGENIYAEEIVGSRRGCVPVGRMRV